jgi:hypothetical protein
MIRLFGIALVTSIVAFATPVVAQDRVEVGVLECQGGTNSFIVGSVTELTCVFKSSTGPSSPYHATIRRVGVDLGLNQRVAVAWAVLAPSRGWRGDLAGSYVGASASATLGVGLGANALIGGSNNTIALQPLSGQAQTGLSIAAGVAGMELRSGR